MASSIEDCRSAASCKTMLHTGLSSVASLATECRSLTSTVAVPFAGVARCVCWDLTIVLKPGMTRWFGSDREDRNSIIDILVAGTGLF
jgi:hypothetical protein